MPLEYSGVTNLFNTHHPPRSADDTIGLLRLGLLFQDAVEVPATSLLCRPETAMLLVDKGPLGPLLTEKLLRPLRPSHLNRRTAFSSLLDDLTASAAVAVEHQETKETNRLAEVAATLDSLRDSTEDVPIDSGLLRRNTTALHGAFMEHCSAVLALSPELDRAMREWFDDCLKKSEHIAGWHWARVAQHVPALASRAPTFTELGAHLFDYGYQSTRRTGFTGRAMTNLTSPLLSAVKRDVAWAELPQSTECVRVSLPTIAFLAHLSPGAFSHLHGDAAWPRQRLLAALRVAHAATPRAYASAYGEAQERLLDYLFVLSRTIEARDFRVFARTMEARGEGVRAQAEASVRLRCTRRLAGQLTIGEAFLEIALAVGAAFVPLAKVLHVVLPLLHHAVLHDVHHDRVEGPPSADVLQAAPIQLTLPLPAAHSPETSTERESEAPGS